MQTGESKPASPAAAKRFDKWVVIGPGGGGAQFNPAVSPHDAKKIFLCSDMSEGYVSEDGGESWRMFNLRGYIRFFALDPVDADVVYAKTIGLWRSADGGVTWELAHPAPENVEKVIALEDHAWERIITKDKSAVSVEALVVDPSDSKTLYAVMADGEKTTLSISTDWGKTWNEETTVEKSSRRIFVDPYSPAEDRTIYVASATRMSVREGGAWRQQAYPEGVTAANVVTAGFGEEASPAFYAVSGPGWMGHAESARGIFVSRDGGATWANRSKGIEKEFAGLEEHIQYQTVAVCPSRPETAYVSYKVTNPEPGGLPLFMGVAKTVDFGKTWEFVWKDTTTEPGPGMNDAWMNERFGPEWGENPFGISVSATDPDVCFASDFGRTLRTTDGGKTWTGVYSKRMEDGHWTTTGLDMTTCYGVHRDPFAPERLFIDYTDIGAFVSENGGVSWKSATAEGVPRAWINTTYWMAFDPAVRGRVWAVMSWVHDLPFAKMWKGQGVAHYNGGVCVSDDGGLTWRKSNAGMCETAATHIIIDPKSPPEARTLYVTGFGTGVWKSVDGGANWTLKNKGIEGKEPFAWRLTMDREGTLYAVIARRSFDGSIGNEEDGAVYTSTDGAESWKRVTLPQGVNGPFGVTVDPDDPARLYLSAWGRYDAGGDVDGGIYLSSDKGGTWRKVFDEQQYIYDVTVDPADSNVLYAGSMLFSVWKSKDRGENWKRIKGYNFKQAKRVLVDEVNPGHIFVTTFGGSVWYGPGDGDPDAVEDIVTPVMRYDRLGS